MVIRLIFEMICRWRSHHFLDNIFQEPRSHITKTAKVSLFRWQQHNLEYFQRNSTLPHYNWIIAIVFRVRVFESSHLMKILRQKATSTNNDQVPFPPNPRGKLLNSIWNYTLFLKLISLLGKLFEVNLRQRKPQEFWHENKDDCPFCGNHLEDIDHLFIHCSSGQQ